MITRNATLFAVSMLIMVTHASLADESKKMGTAGRYRFIPAAGCDQPLKAQIEGACDPASVDPALPKSARIQAHLDRALRLIMLMRMPAAREAADEALLVDPEDFAALKFRGRLALNMDDRDTAWRDVNTALKQMPNDADLLVNRAHLRMARSEENLALIDATAAIKANPKNTDALWTRGQMLMHGGQLGKALADFDAALSEEPTFYLARLFRAQTYMRMGKFEECLKDTDILIANKPGDPSALQVRAVVRMALGQFAQVVDDLNALLGPPGDNRTSPAMSPMYRPFLLQRMIVFNRLGRAEDAQKDMDSLLAGGGKPGILQLQLYLRRNGFAEVPVDGERSQRLENALRACVEEKACLQGLSQRT